MCLGIPEIFTDEGHVGCTLSQYTHTHTDACVITHDTTLACLSAFKACVEECATLDRPCDPCRSSTRPRYPPAGRTEGSSPSRAVEASLQASTTTKAPAHAYLDAGTTVARLKKRDGKTQCEGSRRGQAGRQAGRQAGEARASRDVWGEKEWL